ncbi:MULTISPECIES: hypothetical protein [Bacillaceae]|uniref:hypothetical protein n=1 Tax=Bacillaceae TaxID=186817 RepID=UPI001E50EAA8|nr:MULTISPECIES: hypothetical protein [Bacillaceae]MCE4051645.1 hypothetical protein [Bacillus sp. Au-Bac7]MCM3029637.1 hypothetical protein [Niallia sp. MER 6]MDL0437035.1 hypothetical protein [Niallia sp. SS-2023]UPO87169.1 hypothetical protein L8T27_016645 [Niallia sp. Man26]
MTGLVAVIMVFAIPIIAIVTEHSKDKLKLKRKMIQDEITLEKLRHENFLLETDKMKLEVEKMEIENKKLLK